MGEIREELRESGNALGAVLRNPALRRIQLAFAGSVIGDWAYSVAAAIYLYTKSGPGAVGALGVVRFVLMALVTPFASTLADRFPRRSVMVVSDIVRAALVVTAAIVIEVDGPVGVVLVLAVCTSLAGTAFRPAQSSLLPSLVDEPSELTAANVASSTIESVGFFAGPALAAFMLAVTDVWVVYLFDAATFVWSALLVMSVHKVSAAAAIPKEEGERPKLFSGVGAGFTTILSHRDLRLIGGLYMAQTIIAGASLVYEVAIAVDLLGLGESGLGYLSATLGIGGLLGGFMALILARHHAYGRYFAIGVMLWSAPLVMVAGSPNVVVAVAAMILIGLGNSIVDINAHTMLQRIVPEEVMGRVFGAMDTALIAGMAIGSLSMPLLIEAFGIRWGLVTLGGLVSLIALSGYRGLRRVDRTTMRPRGLDLIGRVPLFSPLPDRTRERLAHRAVVVPLAAGAVLFHEGDVGDRFYVVETGSVRISRSDGTVVDVGPGEYFGEVALLRDAPRNATISANDDVVLLGIDRDVFLNAVTSHDDAMGAADAVVSRRLAFS